MDMRIHATVVAVAAFIAASCEINIEANNEFDLGLGGKAGRSGSSMTADAGPDVDDAAVVDGALADSGTADPADTGANASEAGSEANVAEVCSLPFEVGPCRASMAVFWFDTALQSCQPGTYGGCQGTVNRFDTLEACEAACSAGVQQGD